MYIHLHTIITAPHTHTHIHTHTHTHTHTHSFTLIHTHTHMLQGPVTFKVQAPSVPDRPEWKLAGQIISITLPITDPVSEIHTHVIYCIAGNFHQFHLYWRKFYPGIFFFFSCVYKSTQKFQSLILTICCSGYLKVQYIVFAWNMAHNTLILTSGSSYLPISQL